ncbi:SOS response-associated peptidase family protein [Aquincola sp. S2]|uniref:SOS response-associated peptidase family protein n=1 Tax=Pseudaquabacterium terrae TaxID=2732868 RepID=A0ABX2ESA7_9BURK|nr:SOS response-associated peptidase family protein [Aquabacterium terrae]NRF71319.1 SOS response-associated peptidase family protein [Aquabacterium terrae]
MCYSAQIIHDYRRYVRTFGADIDLREFVDLFWRRRTDPKVKVPKAMELAFSDPQNEEQRMIRMLIEEHAADQTVRWEQDLFKQRKRKADAERALQSKPTKAAAESLRIAINKIEAAMGKLADMRRTELIDDDCRIYPGYYAPVLVVENGRRVVKPMRYQCRPAGKPAFYDTKYPGTYNARRDNLQGFWKGIFGYSHGITVVNAFYENVNLHRVQGRELAEGEEVQNAVLEFRPRPTQDMLVACLWSRSILPGEPELLSFAAITDEPPPEVSAAGHDRCIIPLRPENIDAWLNPDPRRLGDLYAILDDRERPYYEHRLAA